MLPRAAFLVDQCMHIAGVERSTPPWTGGPVPNLQFVRNERVGVGSHVEQDATEFSDRCRDVGLHGQRRETVDPCLIIALHYRKHLLSLFLLESSMVFSIVQKPRGSVAVIDNYKQENITTVNARKARAFRCVLQILLRSLYCLIIRTFSFCSSSRNKVADPQAIKVASRGNGPQFLITELKFMLNQQTRYGCFFVQACAE
ncbi:hypothetical protein C1H46_023050 [Malus baccata]|uniref:Uncharacterized protein n=1 Tax=Malus baccata TaxID=106549 RepID=A0A540LY02_MALBA|nr:hypothetical protein C1H46_023050 [Malus baccata]